MSSSSNLSLNSDLIADLLSTASQFDLSLDSFSEADLALGKEAVNRTLSNLPSDLTTLAASDGLVFDLAALATDLISKGTLSPDSLTDIATNLSSAFQPAFQKPLSAFNHLMGLPDSSGFMGLPTNAAAFTTLGSNGERVDGGLINGQPFTGSQLRWNNTDSAGATLVTFAFDDSFGVNGVGTDRAKALFVSALQAWANYAPLNFVETADPGSGDKVDIFAQSAAIDGLGATLAYTYFPIVGDITYDTAEAWTESTFLETTVHELGHALGLDHEDDTASIMNSVLASRYTDTPFLFEDDINGIRSLYGSGIGSVITLNPLPLVPEPTVTTVTGPNLVINGSFEDVPVSAGEFVGYSQVKGWSTISGDGFWVDRRPEIAGKAADGTAWVKLDMNGKNSTIGQNIDTLTGQSYSLSVEFSNGGEPDSTTAIEVFWEGIKLDTLSGGGKGSWKNFGYEVKGGDRSVSTLAFRAIGPADNVGGFIDNIIVTAAKEALIASPEQVLGTASMPTANRDPISGECHDPAAADGLSSHQPLTPSTSPDWV